MSNADAVERLAPVYKHGTIQNDKDPLPKSYTLSELIRLMITVSDNTATNRLIDFAGGFDPIKPIHAVPWARHQRSIPSGGSSRADDRRWRWP